MGLTVSRKKANKFRRHAKRLTNFYRPFFGKKFNVSRKMEKNVTVSRRSHYPIETLTKECLILFLHT